jgi:hypothetical protein
MNLSIRSTRNESFYSRLVLLLSVLGFSSGLGCAGAEDAENWDDEPSSETEASSKQAILLPVSNPPKQNQQWYSIIKDNFYLELPSWHVCNNGCWGSCNVDLSASVIYTDGDTGSNKVASVIETYRGPDRGDWDWIVDGLAFSVERKPGACFTLWLTANRPRNINVVEPRWCWDESTRNWEPRDHEAAAIGTDQSIHGHTSLDFSFNYNFRIHWDSTTMSGVIPANTNCAVDTPEAPCPDWHHLPQVNLWNYPSSVNVRMENTSGDADLYTSASGSAPTFENFDCRPYSSGPSDSTPVVEECNFYNRQSIWVGVHNYSSAMSAYQLTITPTY